MMCMLSILLAIYSPIGLQRVVGQDDALETVGNIVRLSRTRLQADDSTLGNLLFIGPTGKLMRALMKLDGLIPHI
jgi:hypothetical protein